MDFADGALVLPDGSEVAVAGELFFIGPSLATWAGVIATNTDLVDSLGSHATLRLATGDHTVELRRQLSPRDGSFRYSVAGSAQPPFDLIANAR
jgi:hypothetical protein